MLGMSPETLEVSHANEGLETGTIILCLQFYETSNLEPFGTE